MDSIVSPIIEIVKILLFFDSKVVVLVGFNQYFDKMDMNGFLTMFLD